MSDDPNTEPRKESYQLLVPTIVAIIGVFTLVPLMSIMIIKFHTFGSHSAPAETHAAPVDAKAPATGHAVAEEKEPGFFENIYTTLKAPEHEEVRAEERAKKLAKRKAADDDVLNNYGVIDKTAGIYRVPIAFAMEDMVSKLNAREVTPAGPVVTTPAPTAPVAATPAPAKP